MEQVQSFVIDIYTEATPNPETLKFVVNKMLLDNNSADFQSVAAAANAPLAMDLFGFPFVKGVFIMNNFVTITKHPETLWDDIMPSLKAFIKKYVQDGRPIVLEIVENKNTEPLKGEEVISKIKEVLENYVKPAVEMDGGAIQYKEFDEEDGKLTVMLQGSCSGCPSSMITLKSGIENLMKRMVPEVKEVVADAG
jgi:NFU1 iron-sulfur cluster scaffold homolog, mitochondrial